MKPFELVEHTADYAIVARGRDLRELIQNGWDEPGVTKVIVTVDPIPGKHAEAYIF